ncbi:putative RNA-binding protein 18 [Rhizophlyctis rosea]|nr:putative RNA-binding protein 18 [Rhizophlyctis rosea]
MSKSTQQDSVPVNTESVLYIPTSKQFDQERAASAAQKDNWEPIVNPNRIYIGNLDPSVTEYRILKIFGKFGKIAKIDYLWHKHGPKKGEPRGYCFLEYENNKSCQDAIQQLNGTQLGGRYLVVSFSFDHKPEELSGPASVSQTRARLNARRDYNPVQESINQRVQAKVVNHSTDSKIYALERKLQQMQRGGGNDGSSSKGGTHRSHPYKR